MSRVKAWTIAKNPFGFGNPHYPLVVETSGTDWFDAGKGFMCGKITSPDGQRSAIVEMTSGGIVGTSMEDVINDIASCDDVELMRNQIEDALEYASSPSAKLVTENEFWDTYKG